MLDVFNPKSELNRERIKEEVVAVARNSEYTDPSGEWLLDKDAWKVWVEKENIKITRIEPTGRRRISPILPIDGTKKRGS